MKSKKSYLCYVLALIMALSTACGGEVETASPAPMPENSEDNSQLRQAAYEKSEYPLGLDAELVGAAASDTRVFTVGNRSTEALFAITGYELADDGTPTFEQTQRVELPNSGDYEATAVSADEQQVFIVMAERVEDADMGRGDYVLLVYSHDGALIKRVDVPFASDDAIHAVTALENGVCISGLHNLVLFNADGDATAAFADYSADICPPFELDGKLYMQMADYSSEYPRLYVADMSTLSWQEASQTLPLQRNVSITDSLCGDAVINDGDSLYSLDGALNPERLFGWYKVLREYGYNYKSLCRVSDNAFLLIDGKSAGLSVITVREELDTRTPITVAFYGQATELFDIISIQFDNYSPDYKVNCVDYGNDEQGLTRLLADLTTGAEIDLLVSDGQIDPSNLFVDLYPYIDADKELERADFVPQLVTALETDGELNVLWGSFAVCSLQAMPPITRGKPLLLADCARSLAQTDYDGVLFDGFYTKTHLLQNLITGVLKRAYDEKTDAYILDRDSVRDIISVCDTCPLEFSFDKISDVEGLRFSEVLQWKEFGTTDDIIQLEENMKNAYSYFDGEAGGDNFTRLTCASGECYMIPQSCSNKPAAWGFLRTLLSPEWQLAHYADRHMGLPSNVQALAAVVESELSAEAADELNYMIENAAVMNYSTKTVSNIVTESMSQYFSGAADIDHALEVAQSKLKVYYISG